MRIKFVVFFCMLFFSQAYAQLQCTPTNVKPDCPGSYPVVCRKECPGGFQYQYRSQVERAGQNCATGFTQAGTCYGGYYEPGPTEPSATNLDSAPDCNYVEPSVKYMKDTMLASNGQNMTMAGFLKKLPRDVRSNFIFMGASQSLQTANADNPRVIMTSARGDLRVTFNTSPNERGYNKVEISMWNPEKQAFDYQEMEFGKPSGKAESHKDPSSCKQCHGDPLKPNWDNYNYWAGAIPTNKDTLVPNTKETEEYLKLIRRAENAPDTDPMSALILDRPNNPDNSGDRTSSRLRDRLENGVVQLNPMGDNGQTFSGNAGGIGVMMFDRMVARSGCTARREVQEQRPKPEAFNSLKYILMGLKEGCDMDSFVPDWYPALAANRFLNIKDMGVGAEGINPQAPPALSKSQSVMNDLITDTDIRQKRIVLDKIGRQQYFHIKEYLRSGRAKTEAEARTMAIAEMEANRNAIGLNIVGVSPGNGNPVNPYYDNPTAGKSSTYRYRYQDGAPIRTITEDPDLVAKYRYFLEPFGVKMDRWSGSIDETSYSFSDLFGTLQQKLLSREDQESIRQELGGNVSCENLSQRSLASMTDNRPLKIYSENFVQERCKSMVSYSGAPVELLTDVSDQLLESQLPDVFQPCMMCHSDDTGKGYTSDGPPVIPFDNLTKLKKELGKMRGSPTNLGFKIWERVQRHPDTFGAMPKYMGSLSREELRLVKTFLERQNVFQK